MMLRLRWLLVFCLVLNTSFAVAIEKIAIVNPLNTQPRVVYGVDILKQELQKQGYAVSLLNTVRKPFKKQKLVIIESAFDSQLKKEGFSIKADKNIIRIAGADASGILYGCLELSDRIASGRSVPGHINITDAPEMVLRG